MLHSRGRRFSSPRPPGCSSPGGRHLASWLRSGCSSHWQLAGPPDVPVQGAAFLLLPRMFQSRASVLSPPDVPVQGAGPASCSLASFGPQPPGCCSPGGRYLASWPRNAPDVPVQGRCVSPCGPVSFGPQSPGCSSPGGGSSCLRGAAAGPNDRDTGTQGHKAS